MSNFERYIGSGDISKTKASYPYYQNFTFSPWITLPELRPLGVRILQCSS